MNGNRKGAMRAALVAVIALALDQITKAIARSEISLGEQIDFVAGIKFVRVGNDGIAFGLLGEAGPVVIVIAAGAFVLLLAYFAQTSEREGLWLPIGLLAGGALGNLTDRVLDGRVTDFIDPPNWPAFNVADIEITIGVILLILLYLRDPDGDRGSEADGEAEGGAERGGTRTGGEAG